MKIMKLSPNQIITLNDYPVHSNSILSEYVGKCKLGSEIPFVPVIRTEMVRKHLEDQLLEKLKEFETRAPEAEYFMIDGSHRTTALTLSGCKIPAILYEKTEDIMEAGKLVATGQILESGTLNHSLEENCQILNQHFKEKPYFQTVKEKTRKMVRGKVLPPSLIKGYKLK